jgi:phospholipid/cholesterol/gamma-HCH transport system permease protein
VSSEFFSFDEKLEIFSCHGEWTLANLVPLQKSLHEFIDSAKIKIINAHDLHHLDSAGAMQLQQLIASLPHTPELQALSKEQQTLLNLLKQPKNWSILPREFKPNPLAKLGIMVIEKCQEFHRFLAFTGEVTIDALRLFTRPQRIPWRAVISAMETTGVFALPIIALLSFLIGVVLAYQMGLQLKNYGANIYIVDLLGLSILREFSPLITAIIVAGRSGSAFTAQIGTMKIREEIDALRTMGIAPSELLILPKLLALIIVLPLLTVWSSLFGIFGGMVMANSMLHIGYTDFLHRFYEAIEVSSYYTGMLKAPVFGLIIAAIGCYQGTQVSGSATSVGQKTTTSVVEAIFFIIVVDAIFSILFSWLGI